MACSSFSTPRIMISRLLSAISNIPLLEIDFRQMTRRRYYVDPETLDLGVGERVIAVLLSFPNLWGSMKDWLHTSYLIMVLLTSHPLSRLTSTLPPLLIPGSAPNVCFLALLFLPLLGLERTVVNVIPKSS